MKNRKFDLPNGSKITVTKLSTGEKVDGVTKFYHRMTETNQVNVLFKFPSDPWLSTEACFSRLTGKQYGIKDKKYQISVL